MKTFTRLVPCLFLMLPAALAQNTPPSGSYGFLVNASQIDSNGSNGGAILGVMNFDGAGNVSGSGTFKPRSTNGQDAQAIPTSFNGTYSGNPDGTGTATLVFDIGLNATLAVVTTDGGHVLQLLQTGCTPCGIDFPLQGAAGATSFTITGGLPISLFYNGAKGNIPVTLSGASSAGGGALVFTAAPATGTGTAQCPDGTTGTWTASTPTLTLVVNGAGNVHGNFLASVFGTVCGQPDFETLSGLVTGTVNPSGATSLVVHGTGAAISGTARSAGGSSLNGSYGFQFHYSPFPAGSVGIAKFDGAGNVTVALTAIGAGLPAAQSFPLAGTYTINPDGSGTIALKNAASQATATTFAFVITDSGSQLLLLRTDNNAGFDEQFGTARLQ